MKGLGNTAALQLPDNNVLYVVLTWETNSCGRVGGVTCIDIF